MARIRTVKPEYPQHRKTRKVSRDARLLNIHLWNLADDAGRLQELIPWIIGAVFPADEDVSPAVLRGWLDELAGVGLIVRYEVDGEHYIQCHDWDDHQKISHPSRSVLPPFQAVSEALPEDSRNAPGTLPEDSGGERKGREKERKGREAAAPAHVAPIFAALERVAFARNLTSLAVPAVVEACDEYSHFDLEGEAKKFARYWIEGPGKKRSMDDVAWSWRGWLERAKPKEQSGGNARSTVEDDLARLEREHAAALAEEAKAA